MNMDAVGLVLIQRFQPEDQSKPICRQMIFALSFSLDMYTLTKTKDAGCGVRTHAHLCAEELKSSPLTTRANLLDDTCILLAAINTEAQCKPNNYTRPSFGAHRATTFD